MSDRPPRCQHMDPSVASAFVHGQPYLFCAARASAGPGLARSGAKPDTPQPAYLRHPALGQPVRGRGRGHAILPRKREDPLCRGEDLVGLRPGALEVEALKLVRYLDHAARVHDIVGRVDDAVIFEQLVDSLMGKLVVGAAADDLGAQRGHRGIVDRAAQRARGVDVGIRADQLGPAAATLTSGWLARTRATAASRMS